MITTFKIFELYDNFSTGDYFKTRKTAHDKGVSLFTNWYTKLSDLDKSIIEWYRASGYDEVYNFYYKNIKTPDISSNIKKLHDILNTSKNTEELVVYKGTNITKDMVIGDTIIFKNFISTTLHFQYSIFGFTRPYNRCIMKIHLPKGVSCGYISFDEAEAEILINNNMTLKLIGIEYLNLNVFSNHKDSDDIIKIMEFDIT